MIFSSWRNWRSMGGAGGGPRAAGGAGTKAWILLCFEEDDAVEAPVEAPVTRKTITFGDLKATLK